VKTRTGFVSNSSSSSFLMLGVSGGIEEVLHAIARKLDFPENWGSNWWNRVNFGYSGIKDEETGVVVYVGSDYYDENLAEAHATGWQNVKEILENRTLAEARQFLSQRFKDEYGVTVYPERIDLITGRDSNES
jgi:hypothetical protein